jgi:adenylate cyclase
MDPVSERFADRELLRRLLNEFNEQPSERERITKEIDERFTRRLAIVVLDSSGFTRSVRDAGVISFLARLERLERLVAPAIERSGGQVLKAEADNIFAVYPDVAKAVDGAKDILSTLRAVNDALPESEEINVSMGIGYGDVLLIGSNDVFGDEMNVACKLGEDVAERDQILLTPAAREELGETPLGFEDVDIAISGVRIDVSRLVTEED